MKIPRAGLHLDGVRFQASEVNATRVPSALSDGCAEAPNAGGPAAPLAREASTVTPARRSRT